MSKSFPKSSAAAAAGVIAVALALLGFNVSSNASQVSTAADVAVPDCAKPTGTMRHADAYMAELVDYQECLQSRTEALLANLQQPAADPTDPAADPTDPAADPTDPAADPTDPATDPTTDPTDPATDPTDPATDPTDPTDPATDPATGTALTAADFPTRSSVGPATDPKDVYQGDCYFDASESGAVIDGKIVDCDAAGGLRFAEDAANVVFKNSIIRGQMLTTGNTPGDPGADAVRDPVFTVLDSKIIQSSTADSQDRALCCAHYVVRRSLVQGTHSGLGAHNDVTMTGNYITTDGTDSHSSGGRILKNTLLRGNTFVCKPVTAGYDGGCSAAVVFYREDLTGAPAAMHDVTIDGNYFKRGGTTAGEPGGPWNATRFAGCDTADDCRNVSFTGNLFDLGWGTDGGEFPNDAGDVWDNNWWADGAAAQPGESR